MKKIVTLLAAITLCSCVSACGSSGSNSSDSSVPATDSTTKSIVTTETETQHTHDTKKGKCSGCGQYIVDDLYIPTYDDFSNCLGMNMIPNWIVVDDTEVDSGGFILNCHANRNDLLDDAARFSGKIHLQYIGDTDHHILKSFWIDYVPNDEGTLNELTNAITERVTKLYGSPKGKWKKSGCDYWGIAGGEEMKLIVSQGGNFTSIMLVLDT